MSVDYIRWVLQLDIAGDILPINYTLGGYYYVANILSYKNQLVCQFSAIFYCLYMVWFGTGKNTH